MIDAMLPAIVMVVLSVLLMYYSSKWVVKYSIILAKLIGISTFVFSFILVAFSTSLPELSVALASTYNHTPGLSVGDIIGSNFTDLALILGVCAMMYGAIHLKKKQSLELIELLFISFLVLLLLFTTNSLTQIHGVVLIGLFAVLMKKMYGEGHLRKGLFEHLGRSTAWTMIKFVLSVGMLLFAAEIFVISSLDIVDVLGVSATLIGATLVALGTSIPELSFELTALKQKKYEMAMGDLFGSAVTNITLVLGTLSIMNPGKIDVGPLVVIVPFMFVAVMIIWYGLAKKKMITREMGFGLILLYLAYLLTQGLLAKLVPV